MVQIKYNGKIYEAELAESGSPFIFAPSKLSRGLSFSSKKRNMWFIMPFSARWVFWMFGMRFPLKIIFFDKNKKIIDEFKAEPITLNPSTWKLYAPSRPAKYVLEIPL